MKTEEKEASKKYNLLAKDYDYARTKKYPSGWFYNEMLEMPSTLELLGNVKGKKILDFGCGPGIYAKLLTNKGAEVKGFDISKEMIKIARQKNPNLNLKVGSGNNIPFKEKFDIVLAALVLDSFEDWNNVFKQVSRVLKKDGFFVFSHSNPVSECVKKVKYNGEKLRILGKIDYFQEKTFYSVWRVEADDKRKKDLEVGMHYYHKTYETIIKTIIRNGFEIVDYKDAYPLKEAKKYFPEHYAVKSKMPYFCTWKVRKK